MSGVEETLERGADTHSNLLGLIVRAIERRDKKVTENLQRSLIQLSMNHQIG